MKICVIGMGNMGSAIFEALKGKFEVSGCDVNDDVNEKVAGSDAVIIAVKPQNFEGLAASVNVKLPIIISIMAGVSVKNIQKKLGVRAVVRVMPNLPLKVGAALSGWFCSKEVSDKDFVREILECFGEEIEVSKESQIDAITALSGSGPAYYYFLNEALKNAALKYGFSEEQARKIVKTTFFGSAKLQEKENLKSCELREKITSKGGTTEAAISKLKDADFEKIIFEAVEAARKRAEELNQ